jgi:hypothetical protein
MSLTRSEQRFLDQLVMDEIEVQLAMEKLQDEDLFFEYQTPRHLKYNNNSNILNSSNTASEDERETAPSPRPSSLERQFSIGSHRRIQVLEQRKQSIIMNQMWKAHETGLAVTHSASKRSLLLRRESSNGSSSSRGGGFRRSSSAIFRKGEIIKLPPPPPPSAPPPPRRPHHYRRSQSLAAIVTAIPEPRTFHRHRRFSTASGRRKSVTFHEHTDGIPKPRPNKSSSLRRSVSDIQIGYPQHQNHQPVVVVAPKQIILQRQESGGASSIPSLHPARSIT